MATHVEGDPDGLWDAFRALSSDARGRFLERLVADETCWTELENVLDLRLANARASEPVRSLDDVLAEIEWIQRV